MSRYKGPNSKKEIRDKKEKKRKEKEQRRNERKEAGKKSSFDDMIAYVDENGMITDTPPDPSRKQETKLEDIQIRVAPRIDEPIDPIRNGIVTFFNETKGYGFIRDRETRESYFVHVNQVAGEIRKDNLVQFEIEQSPKGLNAVRVKMISDV